MKREPIFDYLRRRLAGVEGMHTRIAQECGVGQSTVSRIHQGVCDPQISTVQQLLDWFEVQDRIAERMRRGRRRSAGRVANAQGIRVSRRTGASTPL